MSNDFFKINVLTFDLSLWYTRPRPFILYMVKKPPIGKTYELPSNNSLRVEKKSLTGSAVQA